MQSTPYEILLLGQLLARPEFLTTLEPNPRDFDNPTARAALRVLLTEGPVMAAPGLLTAAIAALPDEEATIEDLELLFASVPAEEDVTVAGLVELHDRVYRDAVQRRTEQAIQKRIAKGGEWGDIAPDLISLIEKSRGQVVRKQATADAILSRLKAETPKVRWKIGIPDLDYYFKGIDKCGEPTEGLSAQGEFVTLLAPYKGYKTRTTLNFIKQWLDQGASCALFVLEDDDTSYAVKLMSIQSGIPEWKLEYYLLGKLEELSLHPKCAEVVAWFEALGTRLRIYDAGSANIFDLNKLLELARADIALYGTTHLVVDYVQAISEETEVLVKVAQGLRALALNADGRGTKVNVWGISQMSQETIKNGSTAGMLQAKGSGAFGQAVHVGLELKTYPEVGTAEIELALKVARKAPRVSVYLQFDEESGQLLKALGTPEIIGLGEVHNDTPRKPRGRKKAA